MVSVVEIQYYEDVMSDKTGIEGNHNIKSQVSTLHLIMQELGNSVCRMFILDHTDGNTSAAIWLVILHCSQIFVAVIAMFFVFRSLRYTGHGVTEQC